VRHNRIHDDRPQRDEDHPGRELGAVRDRPADQGGGDDREGELEGGEQQLGHRTVHGIRVDADHADVREVADQPAEAVPRERQRVAEEQPRHRDERNGDEAHHDHVEHAGGPDHPAVEDGQSRRHQQDQCRAGQQPRRRRRIDRFHFGLPSDPEEHMFRVQLDLMKFRYERDGVGPRWP
jgi:hypothetical protein